VSKYATSGRDEESKKGQELLCVKQNSKTQRTSFRIDTNGDVENANLKLVDLKWQTKFNI